MILLVWDKSSSCSPGVVLLFGSGLIGTAIKNALLRSVTQASAKQIDWSWPLPSSAQELALETSVRQAIMERDDVNFSVIWAAGQTGFGSTVDAMADEFAALQRVLKFSQLAGSGIDPDRRTFVHVSSAGGLFEGQVACGPENFPMPLRAYGEGKLAQEQIIRTEVGLGRRLILRPSSVYGFVQGARRGLLATLIASTFQHRPATIFGSLLTLRDYIYAPDIGGFVSKRLIKSKSSSEADSTEICLLASARPASVFEIVQLVENSLGRGVMMKIDPRPENARDNTFLPSVLPADFQPTGLHEGVALTISAITREHSLGGKL